MSIKKYIQSEGFETPNQLKMWRDHVEGLKIYNYPLQKNKEWNAVSNTFDIEAWEEDWDDQETPEKIALKDKMFMKGALREDEQINEIFVVVKDKKDGKYDYLEMKGLSVDELLDKVKNNNNYDVVKVYKESSKAKNKVKALNSNMNKQIDEQLENLVELSKEKLSGYIRKASKDVAQKGYELGSDGYDKKRAKKLGQRQHNIAKAADKLANESIDPEAKLKNKISKMNVNQLKEVIKKLNDMHGDDEDTVFDYATRELEKKMPSKEFVKFMDQLDESIVDFVFPTRDKNKGTEVDSLIITEGKNSNYPITQERAKEIIANTPFMSSYSKNMTDDEHKAVHDFWLKVSSKPNKGHLSFANVLGMIAKGKKIEESSNLKSYPYQKRRWWKKKINEGASNFTDINKLASEIEDMQLSVNKKYQTKFENILNKYIGNLDQKYPNETIDFYVKKIGLKKANELMSELLELYYD